MHETPKWYRVSTVTRVFNRDPTLPRFGTDSIATALRCRQTLQLRLDQIADWLRSFARSQPTPDRVKHDHDCGKHDDR
jgi:hypothetical protein